MSIAYFTHSACSGHDPGPVHPESPTRLAVIETALREYGLTRRLERLTAPPAQEAHLLRVHSHRHLELIRQALPRRGRIWLDPDTALSPGSWKAALYAAGAAVAAVDRVLEGGHQRAFCAVRPPGHHAERERAMGFCLINNIAVAAAQALARGLSRVAIIDFDVHHGNGTEEIFREHPRILYCSSFQHSAYPYPDLQNCPSNTICTQLPPGTNGEAFRQTVEDAWTPALKRFRPQLILVSAGFDAHRDDPLAQLNLTGEDYHWLGTWLTQLAEQHAQGRIVSVLEGGYHLPALGDATAAYLLGQLQPTAAIKGGDAHTGASTPQHE